MSSETTMEFAEGRLRLTLGEVATLEINQPERYNAMSEAMWAAVPAAVTAAADSSQVRALIVTGAGGKAFSSGADISEFATVYASAETADAYNRRVRAAQAALRDVAMPVIAMIEGVCLGGGCGLALACDLRFAASDARFAITPARLGVAYSYADTAQLVEKIGPARAKDMLFSGRKLEAAEAMAFGLIDRVIAPHDLQSETLAYASELAQLSPVSIGISKATINALTAPVTPPDSLIALAADAFSSADFQEGYRAFLEKRKPAFGKRRSGRG